jgi:ubiquitin C-terminal hydrolase
MDKGIIGLKNRGNTCYLNTSLQCLSNLSLLTDYFLSNSYVPDLNNRFNEIKEKSIKEVFLTKEYAKLIKAIWESTSTSLEPKTFHELIQKYDNNFSGFEQQDSQEVLAFILDYLHEGLKYDVEFNYTGTIKNELDEIVIESIKNWQKEHKNKYSIISELFFGQFINKINSLEIETKDELISKNFEIFSSLSLPIYGNTIYDALSKYFEKEILESKYLDEKTSQYINTYRQTKLMRVPKYLIIILKRYENHYAKSKNTISFPIENLDLSGYADGYDKISCMLRLISVGCHIGGLLGGHYFSICRHRNNKWYKYDDESVYDFDIMNNKNNLHSLYRDGYILIYEKLDDN